MPELPEVETVRRTLQLVIGARILSVWDSGKSLRMRCRPPRARLRALTGARITAVRRHGKYLLVDTDRPQSLLVHLGMTGRLCIHGASEPLGKHTHLVLGLGGERELRFTDARRFGQLDVFERAREREHPSLAALGPDPLTHGIDPAALIAAARRRRASLKAFVLAQTVIAGVGNIYASEALWRARLRPTMRSHRLTVANARRLAAAIRRTIESALRNGGTTLSDFVAADGVPGQNADHLCVYDRAGLPCSRCKTLIKRIVHHGRATFYCPTCQAR